MASSSAVQVDIKPVAGFCLKAETLKAGVYRPPRPARPKIQENALEIGTGDGSIAVPVGLKVFVNVAYDSQCPSPPDVEEDVIQRAMAGDEEAGVKFFVPVIVSHGREDKDKTGSPSLVFDAVFNLALKSRVLRDVEFKEFIIELALQNTESLSSLVLSRPAAIPNIRSKGTPIPRTVFVPRVLFPVGHPHRLGSTTTPAPTAERNAPKIEEISQAKGILKSGSTPAISVEPSRPNWTWAKEGDALVITVQLPALTKEDVPLSTLDLEPRRIIISFPPTRYLPLDINLNLSDAELTARGFSEALALKRARELNVDEAKAEWRVKDGVLVLRC